MSFELELHQSIYQRLTGYPGMPAVYDAVPEANAMFPYVVVGEDTHIPFDTDEASGAESTVTLHVWSRYRGSKEAKEIQALIYQALHRYELSLPSYHLVSIEFEYSDVILDSDGKTRHGVCRYRSIIHEDVS
jgi:hypothetical protein